jgi:hypothetical protein
MDQKIVSMHLQQAFLYHLTASKRKKIIIVIPFLGKR